MRVNVYAEEISGDVGMVEKDGHKGVRLFLHSPWHLHHRPDDDDRSAVTFWGILPSAALFRRALVVLYLATERDGLGGGVEAPLTADDLAEIQRLLKWSDVDRSPVERLCIKLEHFRRALSSSPDGGGS
jgi:hypothetical protein